MKLSCDKKYMLLPASFNAEKTRLLFYQGEKLVYDLVIALDAENPEYLFPVNIERFAGEILRVECEEIVDIDILTTDEPPLDYSGKYRPLAHFTSRRGWINDPNGLTFVDDRYLMYYQHNPVATTWENMHWGSAYSYDLLHWKEGEDVLFPDENGTIFSGSGYVDKKNVSGLKQGDKDVILFFYTCAGNFSKASAGKKFTQRLAYSTDGGRTLIKYEKPVIEHITGENRDPKVIYYEKDDSYILVLYLEEHDFGIFKSKNLLDWKGIQRIALPEDDECPDFYPLVTEEGEEKWVFTAAHDTYLIGSFDGVSFVPEGPEQRLHYGNGSYAAQSWSELPGGRRVRTAFAPVVIPGEPFGSCLNVPQEMSLKKINGRLKLCASPVKELSNLYSSTKHFEKAEINENHPFMQEINSRSCDLEMSVSSESDFRISLFGLDIQYKPVEKSLICGDKTAPATGENGIVTIRVIYDTVYTEIFADGGSVFMGMTYMQGSDKNTLIIESSNGDISDITISEIQKWYE